MEVNQNAENNNTREESRYQAVRFSKTGTFPTSCHLPPVAAHHERRFSFSITMEWTPPPLTGI